MKQLKNLRLSVPLKSSFQRTRLLSTVSPFPENDEIEEDPENDFNEKCKLKKAARVVFKAPPIQPDTLSSIIKSLTKQYKAKEIIDSYHKNKKQFFTSGGCRYDERGALSFTAFHYLQSYGVTSRILADVNAQYSSFAPISLLDFGSGSGASTVAALTTIPSITSSVAIERNVHKMSIFQRILNDLSLKERYSNTQSICFSDLMDMNEGFPEDKKFDLIVASSVFSEIRGSMQKDGLLSSKQEGIVKRLHSLLSPTGVIIFSELNSAGAKYSTDRLIQFIRSYMIDSLNCKVIAPCTHSLPCPLLKKYKRPKGRYCGFPQTTEMLSKEFVPTNESKLLTPDGYMRTFYSYVALTPNQDFKHDHINSSRIVENPKKRTGHVHVPLCSSNGQLNQRIFTKSKTPKPAYRASRKSTVGGLWIYEEEEESLAFKA